MDKKSSNFILEGSLLKVIFTIGWPIALSSVMQTLNNLIDAFWLGKLGRTALSAPAISFQLIFLGISLGMGFSMAGTTLISQYRGAGNTTMSRKTSGQLLLFIMMFSVILSVTFLAFSTNLLKLISTPQNAFYYTLKYFRIISLGLPLSAPFFVFQAIMYGYGDSKSPLKVLSVSIFFNLIMDPLLIFGIWIFPELKVSGAAIATIISNGISSAIALIIFFNSKSEYSIKLKHMTPSIKIIKKIYRIGLPTALGMAGTSLGFIIVQTLVNRLGTAVVATAGIGFRMIHLFMLPAMGISTSVSTIVGQSIGAELYSRAEEAIKTGIRIAFVFLSPFMLLISLKGELIMKVFIPNDTTVQQIGSLMFMIVAPSVLFFSGMRIILGAFQGAGYTKAVMIISFLRLWGVRIPFIWFFTEKLFFGHTGVWLGMLISNFLAFLIAFMVYKSNKWKIKVV